MKKPLIAWTVLLLIVITCLFIPSKCNSQSVYTGLQFDPCIITGGPRIDLVTKNIDINTSYSIGKPWYYNKDDFTYSKVILTQYQIGLGYYFKEDPYSKRDGLIASIFYSYNTVNHQHWKNSYGVSILVEITKRFYVTMDEDIILWSTKIGFGFKF